MTFASIKMERHLKCGICSQAFSQNSSLIRHAKKCTNGPVASVRQRSCRWCTRSKTKCDLLRPKCTRCTLRNTTCEYIVPTRVKSRSKCLSSDRYMTAAASAQDIPYLDTVAMDTACAIPSLDVIAPLAHMDFSNSLITDMLVSNIETGQGALSSFTPLCADGSALSSMTLDQVYPGIVGSSLEHTAHLPDSFGWDVEIDHSGINQDDWRLWKPGSTVALPPLAKHSMENLLRVMKTWPKMLTKGFQAPPMFHYTHVFPNHTATSIANCITLAKAWVHQTDGDNGRIQEAIRQEMYVLFRQHRTMDEPSLLSAIQAMVIYTIMIIFPASNQSAVCLVDPAIFLCLQKAVSYVASTGLMTTEETENRLPSWECWVHVTAKRRALLSLYLLHWSYSLYHGLESFACSQLGFMPAPAAKFLWQSKSVNEWENLYSMWLAQWGDHPYTMRDFATIEASTNLDERAQIWLEDTDELGMLFFSIVNATDRGEPRLNYGHGITVITSE